MKVWSKPAASLAFAASASRFSRLTVSILLRSNNFGWRISPSRSRSACTSSSMPLAASMRSATISASRAPPQAVSTIARSSRRFGLKMPGVSTKTICDAPAIAMPRTIERVVCTLWLTMVTLVPTSRLTSVDLPAFGTPISATKPQRVAGASTGPLIVPSPIRPRAVARRWPRPAPPRAGCAPRRGPAAARQCSPR